MSDKNKKRRPVDVRMVDAAALFRKRNESSHGATFLTFGAVMHGLFPKGLTINTPDDWTRLGLHIQMAHKLARYSTALANGNPEGGEDSLDDLSVYAQMTAYANDALAENNSHE